jgi:hypothetical protein
MAIVQMHKRVERFFNQLESTAEKYTPNPQFFDYEDDREVYLLEEDVVITLQDFDIMFFLTVEQKGTYDPGDHICQAPSFDVEETYIYVDDLVVFDLVGGDDLNFNREEFTEIVEKVKELINI